MLPHPTLKDLQTISEEYNLKVPDDTLSHLLECISQDVDDLQHLDEWQNPLDDEKHKYADRQYHRPTPQENRYNAWYHKCNIKGGQKEEKCPFLVNKRLAIKDNIFIGMVPLMNGSKIVEGFIPDFDATVVERILNHGGTILGNVTCENMCLSGGSYNTTYGPVRNPWNPDYSAGGSSSGSGVVVATGEVDMALGGDQGGSIRIPSSSCGIVGLKPTFGLVPYTGIISIIRTLDHAGPMARNVTDCARLLTAIAGFDDGKDDRQPSTGIQFTNFLEEVESAKPGILRIGVLKEGFEDCDHIVNKCVQNAVSLIKSSTKFVTVEEVSIPEHSKALIPFYFIVSCATKDQLIDGCGYGTSMSGVLTSKLSEKLYGGLKSHAHTLHLAAKKIVISSEYIKKFGGSSRYINYAKAQTWCWHIGKAYDKALETFDVLLMPTLNKLPVKIPTTDSHEDMESCFNMSKNTAPFDMTHHPAITLNAGYDEETNLPIGVQLVGRLWDDATVLKAAKLAEETLSVLQKPFNFSE